MNFEFKPLSSKAVPRALERAQRYRLLNEPEQAESICRDVLRVEPRNQKALVMLLLALTDQFNKVPRVHLRARKIIDELEDPYQRDYYAGLVWERRARAKLRQEVPGSDSIACNWLREAMGRYEEAEKNRPEGNDDALLRWNACARTIMDRRLQPSHEDSFQPLLE